MSKDIVSEPQRSVVRESGDTYCDLSGVKTNLTAAGEYLVYELRPCPSLTSAYQDKYRERESGCSSRGVSAHTTSNGYLLKTTFRRT